MNTDVFNKTMKNPMKLLYTSMWDGNDAVNNADIEESFVKIDKESCKVVTSKNSYSFSGKDKAETLIKVFGINEENRDLFKKKFDMACGGSGQEERRITTLHSSSLCALLFFYNVTDNHPLTIKGVGTFKESVFEFRSPVRDEEHPSCMDVVLIGEDEEHKPLVLFLESKFSEYYTSAVNKLDRISDFYIAEDSFGKAFYDEQFLATLGTKRSETKDGYFSLISDEKYYIGGIKQMISHYVGVRNNLAGTFASQKNPMQNDVIDAIKTGAQVKLAEILFDRIVGDFTIEESVTCKESYSKKYRKLAKKMNDDIESVGLKGEFSVLSDDLYYYDLFFDSGYEIEQNVRKYYFGK